MMWYKTSTALYKLIISDNVLTILTVAHMKRLSSAHTVDLDFFESTVAYLKARLTRLNERERNIAILMDEVKNNQSVEYVSNEYCLGNTSVPVPPKWAPALPLGQMIHVR